jgi:lysozyme family protein
MASSREPIKRRNKMAKIEKLAPFILKWEEGYSNDPQDAGGATMKGITLATFQSYRKSKGLPTPTVNDLKNISDNEWMNILRTLYWNPWQADKINSQAVANLLVGWGWGSGVVTAIKQAQKLLGVAQDGIIGPKTLEAINKGNPADMFHKIWLARKDFFVNIVKNNPSQIKWLGGWLNRLYDNIPYNFNFTIK